VLSLRPGAVVLVAGLLLTGCTGEGPSTDVARTDGPTSSAATGTAAPDPGPTAEALDFGGGTGGTVPGCTPRRTYLAAYQSFEVTREVRLGEPTIEGEGRLVGDVLLLPPPRRGVDNHGVTSIADRPSLQLGRTSDGWGRRVPLDGQLVRPGEHALFVQVEARPGRDVAGISFPWSDGSTTGSDRLELGLRYARRCRG